MQSVKTGESNGLLFHPVLALPPVFWANKLTVHSSALEHASAVLRADRQVVLAACSQNGSALNYALDPELWADSTILQVAMRAGLTLHAKAVALVAVECAGRRTESPQSSASGGGGQEPAASYLPVLSYASAELKSDREVPTPPLFCCVSRCQRC